MNCIFSMIKGIISTCYFIFIIKLIFFLILISFRLLKDKNANQAIIEKNMKYEEDFAKIQAATQIKDFEQLVSIFVKNEEKVLFQFSYL